VARNSLADGIERGCNEIRTGSARLRSDQRGTTTGGTASKDVAIHVADHPRAREVDIQLAAEVEQEPGTRLAACATFADIVEAVSEAFNLTLAARKLSLN